MRLRCARSSAPARSSTCSARSRTPRARATASSASTPRGSRAPTPRRWPSLGARRALVVHGAGGVDELTPSGPSLVVEVRDGRIAEWQLDPASLGLERSDAAELRGGDATDNAATIRRVLAGERGARRDAVVLNAGAALLAAGIADDLREGVAAAAAAIDEGVAEATLERLVEFSNAVTA